MYTFKIAKAFDLNGRDEVREAILKEEITRAKVIHKIGLCRHTWDCALSELGLREKVVVIDTMK